MAVTQQIGRAGLGFLQALTRPFRKGVGIGTRVSRGIAQKTGRQITPEQEEGLRKLERMFLSEEERKGIAEKPLGETAAKTLAGQAAFFVPGGKSFSVLGKTVPTLAAKALSGAGAGALAGLGESKRGEELQTALGGAALGGALVGAGALGGKFANRLQKFSGKKAPTIAGKKLKATPFFTQQKKELSKVAGKIGIKDKMSSADKMNIVSSNFDETQKSIESILQGTKPINEDKIVDIFFNNFKNSNLDEAKPATKRLINVVLGKLDEASGDNVALSKLKSVARGEMGNAFKKGGENLTDKQEAWGVLFKTIQETLDNVSPEIRKLNKFQKNLFDLADEFVPAAQKATERLGIRVPLTDVSLPTPVTKETAGRAAGAVGRAVAAPVTVPAKAAGRAVGALAGLPEPLRQAIQSAAIPTVVGQATQEPTAQPQDQPTEVDRTQLDPQRQQALDIIDQAEAQAGQAGGAAGIPQITPQMASMAQLLLAPKDAAKIKSAFDIQQKAQKAATSSPNSSAAMNVLSSLKSTFEQVQEQGLAAETGGIIGRVTGAAKGRAAAITQSSPEAATYKDSTDAFMSLLSRGLGEKGVLTDKDIDRVRKAIPGFSDSPETASNKWKQIENILDGAVKKESALTNIDNTELEALRSIGLNI
jgi:hypothetical protein